MDGKSSFKTKSWRVAKFLLKLNALFLVISIITGVSLGLYLSFTDNPTKDAVQQQMRERGLLDNE